MYDWLISHGMWSEMFQMGAPLLEKAIRPCLIYLALIVLLRLFGKRELAQLNQFDLIVLMILSETVQNGMIGRDDSVTGGVIGAFSLLGVNSLMVRSMFRHRRLDHALEGNPKTLIQHGRLDQEALARELMTESELKTALNKQGIDSLDEVECCTLEPGGNFNVERKKSATPEFQQVELMRQVAELQRKLDLLLAQRAG